MKEEKTISDRAKEYYKSNWNIKVEDNDGYISTYHHTPIELIKFAINFHKQELKRVIPSDEEIHLKECGYDESHPDICYQYGMMDLKQQILNNIK